MLWNRIGMLNRLEGILGENRDLKCFFFFAENGLVNAHAVEVRVGWSGPHLVAGGL